MSLFKTVKVVDVNKETSDAVSVAFGGDLKNDPTFNYKSGQYITIKKIIKGEDVRRSYSLSSAPSENDFRIAVKKIEGGKMSSFLNDDLKAGDELEIMSPIGNFSLTPENDKYYVGFAAGSGITPIISMIKEVLSSSNSKFKLFYGNKTNASTIFRKELDQLVAENPDRLKINYIYSKQVSANKLFEGRITKEKFEEFLKEDVALLKANGFYLCGPEQMINEVSERLSYLGVDKSKVHFELFTAPTKEGKEEEVVENNFSGTSKVTAIMDGEEVEFELAADGDFILDASIDHGIDAPFSCKGAVCCTCKAQVIEGKAIMEMNYSLSDAEVEEGFILTCQAHPASEKVVVDFDVT
jgi:ring-1,2-phenylacetyl-CoA epoxidase subunit PaaE